MSDNEGGDGQDEGPGGGGGVRRTTTTSNEQEGDGEDEEASEAAGSPCTPLLQHHHHQQQHIEEEEEAASSEEGGEGDGDGGCECGGAGRQQQHHHHHHHDKLDSTEFISPKPWWRLLLSMTWLIGSGVIQQSLSGILLPAVVRELKPVGAASIVGIAGGISIIFELSGVACIYWSDRCVCRLGRRRPFVILASVVILIGLLGFLFGDIFELLSVLLLGYFITFTGIAIGSSTMSALLPDICPSSQHGMGSASSSIATLGGTTIGFMLTSFDLSTELICGLYCAAVIVCTIPTIIFAQERTWNLPPEHPVLVASKQLSSRVKNFFVMIVNFFKSYTFSPRKHPDFLLSLIMTGCWFLASTSSVYRQYWLADIACVTDASSAASIYSLIRMGTSVIFSIPFGPISDKIIGRKPFALLAMTFEAGCEIAFIFVRKLTWIYVIGMPLCKLVFS
ncbi:hypothetical protein Pelo_15061 [Pelomyxa schiedti]|nr:hypothetical protein Pelo_15061 [Pelomyxa schiedti]